MELEKYYHIYTHAIGSENLFRSDDNYQYFLNLYQKHVGNLVHTLAWCLMPNHLHLLVRVKDEKELYTIFEKKYPDKVKPGQDLTGFKNLSGLSELITLQFSHLFNAYSKAYNKMYQRKGSLFVRGFKRKEITSSEYLSAIIRYIHTNPVHHGFVPQVADWKWSSYHAYTQPAQAWIARDEVLAWFGSLQHFLNVHTNNQHNPHHHEMQTQLESL